MSRATIVYVTMIGVLIGGLWAVLAVGGRLVAPEDLAGRWTAVPTPAAGNTGRWPGLTVEQSGEFLELSFDNGPQAVPLTRTGRSADDRVISLARGPWRVTVDGARGQDVRTFHLSGPDSGTFTGRRGPPPTTAPAAGSPIVTPTTKGAP